MGSSDSDSDDDKRVVRSAKDRRFDELKGTCEEMRVRSSSIVPTYTGVATVLKSYGPITHIVEQHVISGLVTSGGKRSSWCEGSSACIMFDACFSHTHSM